MEHFKTDHLTVTGRGGSVLPIHLLWRSRCLLVLTDMSYEFLVRKKFDWWSRMSFPVKLPSNKILENFEKYSSLNFRGTLLGYF